MLLHVKTIMTSLQAKLAHALHFLHIKCHLWYKFLTGILSCLNSFLTHIGSRELRSTQKFLHKIFETGWRTNAIIWWTFRDSINWIMLQLSKHLPSAISQTFTSAILQAYASWGKKMKIIKTNYNNNNHKKKHKNTKTKKQTKPTPQQKSLSNLKALSKELRKFVLTLVITRWNNYIQFTHQQIQRKTNSKKKLWT